MCSAAEHLRPDILSSGPFNPKHKFSLLGDAVTGTEKSSTAAAAT